MIATIRSRAAPAETLLTRSSSLFGVAAPVRSALGLAASDREAFDASVLSAPPQQRLAAASLVDVVLGRALADRVAQALQGRARGVAERDDVVGQRQGG